MGVLTMRCRAAPGHLRGSRLNWNGTFDGQNWKCSPRKACGHREQVVVSGRSNASGKVLQEASLHLLLPYEFSYHTGDLAWRSGKYLQ